MRHPSLQNNSKTDSLLIPDALFIHLYLATQDPQDEKCYFQQQPAYLQEFPRISFVLS